MQPSQIDLWLVRHAESLGNLDGTDADTPLSPGGRAQARALAERLRGTEFGRVASSPLQRALETARLALPGHTLTIDTRLRELVTVPERFVDLTTLSAHQLTDLLHQPALESVSESGHAFRLRIHHWLVDVTSHDTPSRVIAFTHAGVVREILRLADPTLQTTAAHASITRMIASRGPDGLHIELRPHHAV